jgi:triosephosphate isomerase
VSTSRIPVLAANWKMFKTTREALAYARELTTLVRPLSGVDIVIAPPFTALATVVEIVRSTAVGAAAQDVYFESEGAFTGEVSAPMIKEAGAGYVIVGHSERRRLFGETDDAVRRKVRAAIAAELVPIVCIGETLEERDGGHMPAVLDRQLKVGLDGVTPDELAALIIAYEPVWAIGTGRTATPAEADESHQYIRRRLREWWGDEAADRCRIQYGGSVKPDNIRDLMTLPDVDGALVGGASLDVGVFFRIVEGALEGQRAKGRGQREGAREKGEGEGEGIR